MEFSLLRGEGPLFISVIVLPLAAFLLYSAFQTVLLSEEHLQVSAAFKGFIPVAVYSNNDNIVLQALTNFTRFELVRARGPDHALALVTRRQVCMAVVLKDFYVAVNHTGTVLIYTDMTNPKTKLALRDLVDIVRTIARPVVRENLRFAVEVEAPIAIETVYPDDYANARDRPLNDGDTTEGQGPTDTGTGAEEAEKEGRLAEQSIPLNVIFVISAFLVGAFLISGMCAMSLANERVRHQGEFLFSAPLEASEVLLGKVAPYAGLIIYMMVAVSGYLAWSGLISNPVLSFALLGVVGALPLAIACLIGTVAASFHQLTFLLTFSYFLLFLVFVLPALLVKLTLASFVSPVTVLILLALKAPLIPVRVAISLTPSLVIILVTMAATRVLFTAENLLYEAPSLLTVVLSLADAVLARFRGWFGEVIVFPFIVAVAVFPLAFIVELVSLFILFSLFSSLTTFTLILTVPVWALAEEVAKSVGVFILAYRRPEVRSPLAFAAMGAAAGLGFFAAEKTLNILLLANAVTLDRYLLGIVLVATTISAAIQAGCSAIYGLGIYFLVRRRNAIAFAALFFLAVALHFVADVIIISRSLGVMGWG